MKEQPVPNVSPRWYQDLSIRQMKKLFDLERIMRADYDERVTERTQRALNDIGVTSTFVRVTPREIKKLRRQTNLDPVKFLCEIYRRIGGKSFVDEEYKNVYDCNERIVLSSIAFLTLPEITIELHRRLPPPVSPNIPPKPVLTKIRPRGQAKSPYLEPPFVPQNWLQYKKELNVWRKYCQTIARPKIILPNCSTRFDKILEVSTIATIDEVNSTKMETSESYLLEKIDKNEDVETSGEMKEPKRLLQHDENFVEKLETTTKMNLEKFVRNKIDKNFVDDKILEYQGDSFNEEYVVSAVSLDTSDLDSVVTQNNSDDEFFKALNSRQDLGKTYPRGRDNLSRNWREWLDNVDEDYAVVEKRANEIIKSFDDTLKLMDTKFDCDGCCACRETKKARAIYHRTKKPRVIVDSIAIDEKGNKYVVGALAMISPGPSPSESTENVPDFVASHERIAKTRMIDGSFNENGKTIYHVSGISQNVERVNRKIVDDQSLPKPVKNVPPCGCVMGKIVDEEVSSEVSSQDDVSGMLENNLCVGKKYRPLAGGTFSCKHYPNDGSCRRKPTEKKINEDNLTKLGRNENEDETNVRLDENKEESDDDNDELDEDKNKSNENNKKLDENNKKLREETKKKFKEENKKNLNEENKNKLIEENKKISTMNYHENVKDKNDRRSSAIIRKNNIETRIQLEANKTNEDEGPFGWRTKSEEELLPAKTLVYLVDPEETVERIPVRTGGRPCKCRENRNSKKILLYGVCGLTGGRKEKRRDKFDRVIDGLIYVTPTPSVRNSDEYIPEYELSDLPYEKCLAQSSNDNFHYMKNYLGPKSLVNVKSKKLESCNCSNKNKMVMNELENGESMENEKQNYSNGSNIDGRSELDKFSKAGHRTYERRLQVKRPVCECKYERKIVRRDEERKDWFDRQTRLKSLKKIPRTEITTLSRPRRTESNFVISNVTRMRRNEDDVDDIDYCVTGITEHRVMGPVECIVSGIGMHTPTSTPEPSKQDVKITKDHRHWSLTNILARPPLSTHERVDRLDKSNRRNVKDNGGHDRDKRVAVGHLRNKKNDVMENRDKNLERNAMLGEDKKNKKFPSGSTIDPQGSKTLKTLLLRGTLKKKEASKLLSDANANNVQKGNSIGRVVEKEEKAALDFKAEKNHRGASIEQLLKDELEKMADEGFVFAQLPACWKIPQLRYWLMYRKGIALPPEEKKRLMDESMAMWNSAEKEQSKKIEAPSFDVPPAVMNKWNFDQAEEIKREIAAKKEMFYSDFRKLRVLRSRSMWGTMEFGKFPGISFKRAYFTYLASKESDGFVFKPWKNK